MQLIQGKTTYRFWLALVAICLMTNFAQAGGMSAGGGNFLLTIAPENPGPVALAQSIANEAHGNLADYLRAKKQAWLAHSLPAQQQEAFAPLFSSQQDVLTIVASRQVDVEAQDSCWDANRDQVDGSIFAKNAHAVCLSARNLSLKSITADYYPQSLALLGHEFGELAGLSEDQAVLLQKQILLDARDSLNE